MLSSLHSATDEEKKGGDNVLNVDKIRGRMAELRITQKDVANELGLAIPTVSQKLNRVRPMDLDEAEKLAVMLHITDDEFGEFFFARELRSAT